MGSFHPTRLSFARALVRRMAREDWTVCRQRFDLDDTGTGTAIYRVATPLRPIWFVVFADHLDPADRTDRVIAEKWDATFTLTEAEPDTETLARLAAAVPRQEAGRCSERELVLSRANKSVRLFDHVADRLAAGRQPDRNRLLEVGYLVRTTAVYGNGKFGVADLARVRQAGPFGLPFQAEMLCVYLARQFSLDWVEHIAQRRSPTTFRPLDHDVARGLGVGNATGLGMAPFLAGHPKLICRWIGMRETALARVREIEGCDPATRERFVELVNRARAHVAQWPTSDAGQTERIATLARELDPLVAQAPGPGDVRPWDRLFTGISAYASPETQEVLASILIELYPELSDGFDEEAGSLEEMALEPDASPNALRTLIEDRYGWALGIDFSEPDATALFWYFSQEKSEPRIGHRAEEPGADREMPVAVARDVAALHRVLVETGNAHATVAGFLLACPEWRGVVRRVQGLASCPYAEIRDNLVDRGCRPIDLLRCKLAILGATRFDPKSDLWTRVTLFQGAPLAGELDREDADDWAFASLPGHAGA